MFNSQLARCQLNTPLCNLSARQRNMRDTESACNLYREAPAVIWSGNIVACCCATVNTLLLFTYSYEKEIRYHISRLLLINAMLSCLASAAVFITTGFCVGMGIHLRWWGVCVLCILSSSSLALSTIERYYQRIHFGSALSWKKAIFLQGMAALLYILISLICGFPFKSQTNQSLRDFNTCQRIELIIALIAFAVTVTVCCISLLINGSRSIVLRPANTHRKLLSLKRIKRNFGALVTSFDGFVLVTVTLEILDLSAVNSSPLSWTAHIAILLLAKHTLIPAIYILTNPSVRQTSARLFRYICRCKRKRGIIPIVQPDEVFHVSLQNAGSHSGPILATGHGGYSTKNGRDLGQIVEVSTERSSNQI